MSGNLPSIEKWANTAGTNKNRTLSNLAARARAAGPFKPSGAPLPGFKYIPTPSTPKLASYTNGGQSVFTAPKPRKTRKGRKGGKGRKSRNSRNTR